MSPLSDALFEVARSLFPEVELSPRARFSPMFELEKGEISSTAAIELARATRGDAIQIAQRIIDQLAPRFHGAWKVVAGYIVLSDASAGILTPEAHDIESLFSDSARGPVRTVIVLTPDSVTPLYARLRVLASGALHAALIAAFEGRCRVGFEPAEAQEVTSVSQVVSLFRAAVERSISSEREIRRVGVARQIMADSSEGEITAWTSHHFHEKLPREVRKFFSDVRREGRISLRMPPDGWLLSRDRALSEILSPERIARVVRRLESEELWKRWMMHMASATPSGDIDPSVALYDECASPRWSARALDERLRALVPDAYALSASDTILKIGDFLLLDREMALRALFLPRLTARAVREGEVLGWMGTVERFIARGHALLNSPHVRVSLTKSPLSRDNVQIIASLLFGIASILPVVTEDVCGSRRRSSNQQVPF